MIPVVLMLAVMAAPGLGFALAAKSWDIVDWFAERLGR